jgi:N-acetylglutamate synthase-like GNAT family acetyltransferase
MGSRRDRSGVVSRRVSFSQRRIFATKIFTRQQPAATVRPMNTPSYTVRRATVDDLGGLKILWERARLQVLDLEKRLTEFQLIVSDAGDLIGAIGLHLEGKQGKLHSGAFAQLEQADEFRPQLWERVQSVARNHGLVRLWTQDLAPFWREAGFAEVSPELLKKLPPGFGDAPGLWLALQLKEESAAALSIDHEFELFQAAQKEETERLMKLGRTMKFTVFIVLGLAVAIAAILAVRLVVRNPSLLSPGPR